jgi:phosphohistidine phosphatase
MIVYFVRHASAGSKWRDPKRDERRPLDEAGIEQSRSMGRALMAVGVSVDAIVSSPLKRAAQTAALIGNEIGYEGKLLFSDAMRPEADYAAFEKLLRDHAQREAILIVGHNPSQSEFLGRLVAGGLRPARLDVKKAAAARVDVEHHRAVLKWLLPPRLVSRLHAERPASERSGRRGPRAVRSGADQAGLRDNLREGFGARPRERDGAREIAREAEPADSAPAARTAKSRPKTSRK